MTEYLKVTIKCLAFLAVFATFVITPGNLWPSTSVRARAACQYVISPSGLSFSSAGGKGDLSVLATSGCAWSATSNSSWLTFTTQVSGSGSGRVSFSVSANPDAQSRTATISIAQQTISITQAGTASPCTPVSISVGQNLNSSLTSRDCTSQLRLVDGKRPFARRFTFSASAGQAIVISMLSGEFDSFLYLVGPSGKSLAADDDSLGSSNSRLPSTGAFLTLAAAGSYTIEATSFSPGALGNFTLSLGSPAAGCSYTLSAAGQANVPAGGTSGSVNVITTAGCSWTAVSNNSWISVTSGSSGSGNGGVSYSIAVNNGDARSGSITIAGLTYPITQSGANAASCPMVSAISPGGGVVGAVVTLSGTNLSGVTGVTFPNGLTAQFTITSDRGLSTIVPSGAISGFITVSKPGCLETSSSEAFTVKSVGALASVSAANYVGQVLAPGMIVAGFGPNLSSLSGPAPGLPLPTTLFGTSVSVTDSTGTSRPAPLFYVSPGQVNYLMPDGTAAGPATVTISASDGSVSRGSVQIATVSPGIFTVSQDGSGPPAAYAIRVKLTGEQIREPVFTIDSSSGKINTLPIDLGPAGEVIVLEIYGTGIRGRTSLAAVTATLGGIPGEVAYAGAQPGYIGLDQVNVVVPRTLAGKGEILLQLAVDGRNANAVKLNFK